MNPSLVDSSREIGPSLWADPILEIGPTCELTSVYRVEYPFIQACTLGTESCFFKLQQRFQSGSRGEYIVQVANMFQEWKTISLTKLRLYEKQDDEMVAIYDPFPAQFQEMLAPNITSKRLRGFDNAVWRLRHIWPAFRVFVNKFGRQLVADLEEFRTSLEELEQLRKSLGTNADLFDVFYTFTRKLFQLRE
jgi:hypothetical protein